MCTGQAQAPSIPKNVVGKTELAAPAKAHHTRRKWRSGEAVDAAIGVGHRLMPVEHVARRLAKIAEKGVRTAKVQVLAGVPCVMTKDLPEGVHAIMLADRIEAVRTATGAVVATVARGANGRDPAESPAVTQGMAALSTVSKSAPYGASK